MMTNEQVRRGEGLGKSWGWGPLRPASEGGCMPDELARRERTLSKQGAQAPPR